jgi:hypothetical protein
MNFDVQKKSFMQNGLNARKLNDSSEKKQALVIYIQADSKENFAKEKLINGKAEMKIPLFYTEPIFKAKKYDFL